jgi:quinol monooxygenase YgiN
MSTPVVVTAYFHPAAGQHDQVVEVLEQAIPAVHEEPGCELYAIHDAPNGTIVMIEKWSSVGELDDHAGGEPGSGAERILGWVACVADRGDTPGAVASRNRQARPTLTPV